MLLLRKFFYAILPLFNEELYKSTLGAALEEFEGCGEGKWMVNHATGFYCAYALLGLILSPLEYFCV